MPDPTLKDQLVSDHAELSDTVLGGTSSSNRTYRAEYSQGVWWAGFWALGLRTLLLGVAVQLVFWGIVKLVPDAAYFAHAWNTVAVLWIGVRFFFPASIQLNRHSRLVYEMAAPPDPALARAIVSDQWALLLRDLTLPWRAIRG